MGALATLLIAALSKDHTDAVDVLERRSAFQMHFFYSPCFQGCCRRFKSRAALVCVRDGERGMGEEKMEEKTGKQGIDKMTTECNNIINYKT